MDTDPPASTAFSPRPTSRARTNRDNPWATTQQDLLAWATEARDRLLRRLQKAGSLFGDGAAQAGLSLEGFTGPIPYNPWPFYRQVSRIAVDLRDRLQIIGAADLIDHHNLKTYTPKERRWYPTISPDTAWSRVKEVIGALEATILRCHEQLKTLGLSDEGRMTPPDVEASVNHTSQSLMMHDNRVLYNAPDPKNEPASLAECGSESRSNPGSDLGASSSTSAAAGPALVDIRRYPGDWASIPEIAAFYRLTENEHACLRMELTRLRKNSPEKAQRFFRRKTSPQGREPRSEYSIRDLWPKHLKSFLLQTNSRRRAQQQQEKEAQESGGSSECSIPQGTCLPRDIPSQQEPELVIND